MKVADDEKRSLGLAKWANLIIGGTGIFAAISSPAGALMLNGLFSGVYFGGGHQNRQIPAAMPFVKLAGPVTGL